MLLHVSMIVRLSDVLAPGLGLVKDRLGKVLEVVLCESDQKRLDSLPTGYCHFVPKFMAKGIWVQLQTYKHSPLSAHIMLDAELEDNGEETVEHKADKSMADSVVFIELINANFKCDINIDGALEIVDVLRWQFPLLHGMLRTAYAAQGLTLHGGVIVDLRRAGGLSDDDWWLAIYVMLSRARRLANMILVGFTGQVEDLLRRGPPTHLIAVTELLQQRAKTTFARYS